MPLVIKSAFIPVATSASFPGLPSIVIFVKVLIVKVFSVPSISVMVTVFLAESTETIFANTLGFFSLAEAGALLAAHRLTGTNSSAITSVPKNSFKYRFMSISLRLLPGIGRGPAPLTQAENRLCLDLPGMSMP